MARSTVKGKKGGRGKKGEGGRRSGKAKENWTPYYKIMKPEKKSDRRWRPRKGSGSRLRPEALVKILPENNTAVYELKVGENEDSEVVYVGESADLKDRMLEYMRDGSHEEENINETLKNRQPIKVHFLSMSSKRAAVEKEKELRKKNYPWNDV